MAAISPKMAIRVLSVGLLIAAFVVLQTQLSNPLVLVPLLFAGGATLLVFILKTIPLQMGAMAIEGASIFASFGIVADVFPFAAILTGLLAVAVFVGVR